MPPTGNQTGSRTRDKNGELLTGKERNIAHSATTEPILAGSHLVIIMFHSLSLCLRCKWSLVLRVRTATDISEWHSGNPTALHTQHI